MPPSGNRMISLSSDPKAEYDAFMKSMKRKSRIVPEFQPFSIHQNYVGGSLSRLDDEIAFLEERKESKAIRRGKRLERWLSCDEDVWRLPGFLQVGLPFASSFASNAWACLIHLAG